MDDSANNDIVVTIEPGDVVVDDGSKTIIYHADGTVSVYTEPVTVEAAE